jgi:hypothetical protein
MYLAFGIVEVVPWLLTLGIVILTWWQLRLIRVQIDLARQQSTTTFEDGLTQQYRRIMESIPIEIWLGEAIETLEIGSRNRCRDAIYRYIDLCQDQVFLRDNGRITEATWTEWAPGIKGNMNIAAFKEVWSEVQAKLPDSFSELREFLST